MNDSDETEQSDGNYRTQLMNELDETEQSDGNYRTQLLLSNLVPVKNFSCDCFVLTPPFKIKVRDISIRTSYGSLEHLVNHLRQNVLQELSKPVELDRKEEEADQGSLLPRPNVILMNKGGIERHKSEISLGSKFSAQAVEINKYKRSYDDRSVRRHIRVDFIAKNKEEAAKTKKIEYDVDDDEVPRKRVSKMKIIEPVIPVKKSSMPVVEETETESEEEKFIESVESNKTDEVESEIPSNAETSDTSDTKKPLWQRLKAKNHIKQTTCPACMERYKTPLPTPKTPDVKKSDVLPEMYANSLRTNSQHRISMMINKAMYKLDSYDRRYSPEHDFCRRISPKREIEEETTDIVYLNPMDLAKIEQEIKERETKKKLEKFLDRYSNDKKDKPS